ncbi:uncharacterized protein MKK02DRAFT_41053 [Dioszegia hungarica]|uniref:Mediator of RNA polymerase II transcription subunit 21 n=1 Tax=Dioszegia hungarica TaxID=4972 RepID=A0AA38H4T4_9TREE|nr:uncharacterized protein MKK02DRAFT_41053 [Dioszegia hungarica]KAI9632741.1 hypothetical protein MKK02DRAFT_41053 [Dioszegia hungarica]
MSRLIDIRHIQQQPPPFLLLSSLIILSSIQPPSSSTSPASLLLTLTHTSIEYITKRTAFEQASADIPRTLASEHTAPPEEYREAIQIFVADIISRSKDVEKLIAALPKKDDSGARAERLRELQGEMIVANQEYKEALAQAESLLEEMQNALAVALDDTRDPQLEETAKQFRKKGVGDVEREEEVEKRAI